MKALFVGCATSDDVHIRQESRPPADAPQGSPCILLGDCALAAEAFACAHRARKLEPYGLDETSQALLATPLPDRPQEAAVKAELERRGMGVVFISDAPADCDALLSGASLLVADGTAPGLAFPLMDAARSRNIPVLVCLGRESGDADGFAMLSDIVLSPASRTGGDFEEACGHLAKLGARWWAMVGGDKVFYSADGVRGDSPVPGGALPDSPHATASFCGIFAKAMAGKGFSLSTFMLALEAAAVASSSEAGGTRGW